MKLRLSGFIVLGFFLTLTVPMSAQTGVPPFASTSSNGGAIINLGNLNVQYGAPIISKPGRGIPFNYVLRFNNSIWFPSAGKWTPVTNWGWQGPSDAVTGRVATRSITSRCIDPDTGFTVFYFTHIGGPFTDGFGVTHQVLTSQTDNSPCDTGSNSGPSVATDGSGYTLEVGGQVFARNGQRITPVSGTGFGSGTLPDSNGNQITATNGVFTDTLGMNVLTVTGGAPNPLVFTYKDSTNTPRSITVNYASYTVKTNFACSGITEYPATSASLVSSIVYPDGTSYSFTYEPTPGFSGDVTGRLHSITLPTGATVTYNYTGANNGIICADGSTAGFDLVTTDGTTSYSRSGSGTNWTTTVLDASTPTRNQTTINFQSAGTNFYETHRTSYSGTTTVLRQTDTCYNGAAAPCTGTAIALPFTKIDTYFTLDNNQKSRTSVFVNSFGLPTEVDEYDFGNGAPGALLRKTVTGYAPLGNNIVDRPSSVTVTDAAGHQIAQTTLFYDEGTLGTTSNVPQHASITGSRGNLTTMKRWLNTTGLTLNSTFTYDDTGDILTATDPGGHQTSFSYADNFSDGVNRNSLAYVSQVTLPDTNSPNLAHHITHVQYEPNTGLPSTSTDQNGQSTTFTYDLMMRPLTINFPDTGQTTFSYPSATQSVVQRQITSTSLSYSTTLLDSYGRVKRTAIQNGESSNPYDLTDVCYDTNGRVNFQSYTYQAAGYTGANVCSGAGDSFTYDALGRLTQVMHSDGTHANASYSGRAQQITDEGNGTYSVSRIMQSDALGRLSGVCELSSSTLLGSGGTPIGCGLDIAATGFLTSYGYDLLNNLTTITQGSLINRRFGYDSLSRLTSESHPEWGSGSQSTYAYNSDSLLISRTRPAPNQSNPAVTVITNYGYDTLHRLISRSYSGDPSGTPSAGFNYDESTAWSQTLSNTIGRMSSESSGSTGQDLWL